MSVIICDELVTTLQQEIEFHPYRNCTISGIKIKLLMYGSPDGTFTLSFKQGVDVLASKDFTSLDIKNDLETLDDYAWLWKALKFNEFTIKSGVYTLELSTNGYSYAPNSFIGWIKDYESVFNERSDEFEDNYTNPYSHRIYELTKNNLLR